MHGIEREMRRQSNTGHGGVTKIMVRYADGRVINFVPDARRETFSEDDILELKKVLDTASSKAEWSDIDTRLGF